MRAGRLQVGRGLCVHAGPSPLAFLRRLHGALILCNSKSRTPASGTGTSQQGGFMFNNNMHLTGDTEKLSFIVSTRSGISQGET